MGAETEERWKTTAFLDAALASLPGPRARYAEAARFLRMNELYLAYEEIDAAAKTVEGLERGSAFEPCMREAARFMGFERATRIEGGGPLSTPAIVELEAKLKDSHARAAKAVDELLAVAWSIREDARLGRE